MYSMNDVSQYLGRDCVVTYQDRNGTKKSKEMHIHDLTVVPLYGTYLVGDVDDIHLEKVTEIKAI
jgi:hypothetical protein